MGQQVNLLQSLPHAKRKIADRKADKSPLVIATAKEYGYEYFDGDRKYGYGGYRYDGRWRTVARDIMSHYKLGPGAKVLDVGCAKGFLVHDMVEAGLDAYGLDVSSYAVIETPHPPAVGRLHVGGATFLPFPDNSFDLVLSINTLHNLHFVHIEAALREMRRVSRGPMFVQVDSYHTPEEKLLFEDWVLTAEFHGYPDNWRTLFKVAGYDGDYDWTIVEAG